MLKGGGHTRFREFLRSSHTEGGGGANSFHPIKKSEKCYPVLRRGAQKGFSHFVSPLPLPPPRSLMTSPLRMDAWILYRILLHSRLLNEARNECALDTEEKPARV